MKIVCVSDSHTFHRDIDIPEGDILIHAGDVSFSGEYHVYKDVDKWFGELPHKHKVVIAGNHDFNFYDFPWKNCKPLLDSEINCNGATIWGSPYSPTFGNWAWMKNRGKEIAEHWDKIPYGIDILVTHGPAFGIGDLTPPHYGSVNAGCENLQEAIDRTRPLLFVCGHIHNGYGKYKLGTTTYINASVCNERYEPVNAPICVEIL